MPSVKPKALWALFCEELGERKGQGRICEWQFGMPLAGLGIVTGHFDIYCDIRTLGIADSNNMSMQFANDTAGCVKNRLPGTHDAHLDFRPNCHKSKFTGQDDCCLWQFFLRTRNGNQNGAGPTDVSFGTPLAIFHLIKTQETLVKNLYMHFRNAFWPINQRNIQNFC